MHAPTCEARFSRCAAKHLRAKWTAFRLSCTVRWISKQAQGVGNPGYISAEFNGGTFCFCTERFSDAKMVSIPASWEHGLRALKIKRTTCQLASSSQATRASSPSPLPYNCRMLAASRLQPSARSLRPASGWSLADAVGEADSRLLVNQFGCWSTRLSNRSRRQPRSSVLQLNDI